MPRSRQSILDDLIALPWWLNAVLFLVLFIVNCLARSGSPLKFACFAGSLILGFAAAISFFRTWRQDRLLAKQTSLASLAALSWGGFEEMLAAAFRKEGYVVTVTGEAGADGGVDLVLRRDGVVSLVQAKHWRGNVGGKVVRELNGVRDHEKAARGIVVTSGDFTAEARAFASDLPIELIDGERLLKFIGSGRESAQQKRSQTERSCPTCRSPMVLRVARKGANPGSQFLGCSRYPTCHGTLPLSA